MHWDKKREKHCQNVMSGSSQTHRPHLVKNKHFGKLLAQIQPLRKKKKKKDVKLALSHTKI